MSAPEFSVGGLKFSVMALEGKVQVKAELGEAKIVSVHAKESYLHISPNGVTNYFFKCDILKCISIYRQGRKLSQSMNSDKIKEAQKCEEC